MSLPLQAPTEVWVLYIKTSWGEAVLDVYADQQDALDYMAKESDFADLYRIERKTVR